MAFGGPAGVAFGLLFLIAVLVAMWALANWQWNTNKQFKISMARGKRVEALHLWSKITEADKFRAKDVFFETKYGGKRLVVLRDGTIESYGSHKIETLDGGGEEGEGEKQAEDAGNIELENGEGGNGEEQEKDEANDMDETDETEVSTSIDKV